MKLRLMKVMNDLPALLCLSACRIFKANHPSGKLNNTTKISSVRRLKRNLRRLGVGLVLVKVGLGGVLLGVLVHR